MIVIRFPYPGGLRLTAREILVRHPYLKSTSNVMNRYRRYGNDFKKILAPLKFVRNNNPIREVIGPPRSNPEDPPHVLAINNLIPDAEKEALEKVKKTGPTRFVDEYGVRREVDMFSVFFHQAMNRLTREKGLRI